MNIIFGKTSFTFSIKLLLFLLFFTKLFSLRLNNNNNKNNDNKYIISYFLKPKSNLSPKEISLLSTKYFTKKKKHSFKKSQHQEKEDDLNDDEYISSTKLRKRITEYSGIVEVGNPPQKMEVIFDTGSANIILTSSLCNSIGCNNHKKYESGFSKSHEEIQKVNIHSKDIITSKNENDKINILFGTGQVKCYFGYDDICLENGTLCAEHCMILEAYDMSPIPFYHVSFDGIIGLSFTYLSISPESNFLEILYKQKQIKNRIFSFYFNKNDNDFSVLNIGGYNNKYFQGDEIYFSNVISMNYWEIKIEGIYYDNVEIINCEKVKCTGIVDTGTSMLTSPHKYFDILDNLIDVDFFCNNIDSLKKLSYKIGDHFFDIEPEFYVLKIIEDNSMNCINSLMEMDALTTKNKLTFILGIPFLKKYYSVFDRENKRIGFAMANHEMIA